LNRGVGVPLKCRIFPFLAGEELVSLLLLFKIWAVGALVLGRHLIFKIQLKYA